MSGDYFRALGIPWIEGRPFAAADDSTSPHVTVVNEALARQLWPGGSAMGKRIRFRGMDAHNETWLTVVGVVRDAKQVALDAAPVPEVYVSYRQRPERAGAMSVMVRTRVARSVADRRFVMLVLPSFGVVALLLAAVGIYGCCRTPSLGGRRRDDTIAESPTQAACGEGSWRGPFRPHGSVHREASPVAERPR